ncbi:glycosyltransferase family 4 protein [Methylobacterium sp. NFXW15]|uniref:glycosyltransferase family 4 protein n=1 Tax=Methylobacterium sp. NFXW15 TaxID=2819512 RepID=UPI003CE7785D
MKKWQISSILLHPKIPFGTIRRRIKRQIDLLEKSKAFDKSYYIDQARQVGITVSPHRATWHYVVVGDKIRLKPHRLFDTHFYHDVYRDIESSGVSALYHFITHGWQENRNPHPAFDTAYVKSQISSDSNPLLYYFISEPGTINPHRMFDERSVLSQIGKEKIVNQTLLEFYFDEDLSLDPSDHFNSKQYLKRYPDIKDLHPFYHYVRWGAKEGRISTGNYNSIDAVKQHIAEIDQVDFDVLQPWQDIDSIGRLSRVLIETAEEISLRKLLEAVNDSRSTFVFITNSLTTGGAEKVLANINNALLNSDAVDTSLIIVTGHGSKDALKWIDTSKHVVCDVSEEFDRMSDQTAALALANFLQLIHVQGLLVVNSRQGWALAERHGRALSRIFPVSVCCFCYDYDVYGRRAGYARTHLPYALSAVTNIITDNSSFKRTLIDDLRLTNDLADKVKVLYQPVEIAKRENLSRIRPTSAVKRVIWAGRFSTQKRLTLAFEIARLMPDIQFVFAGGDLPDIDMLSSALAPNISVYGKYDNLEELKLEQYDLFLYTSGWDGLPNILLEIAAAELPIVAPNVGGISELVSSRTGWIVDEHNEPSAYVSAIMAALEDANESGIRTAQMKDLLIRRHGKGAFERVASDLLIRGD